MADITKCPGKGCNVKDECYRYKAKADEIAQSYMTTPRYKGKTCQDFYHIPKRLYAQSGWR